MRAAGSWVLATRVAAAMMLAGALLIAVTVLLPPPATRSDPLILGLGALVAVVGVALLVWRAASEPVLGLVATLGTAVITLSTYEAGLFGRGADDNEIVYLWVSLYCFYFFSLRHALLQLGIVAAAYGALLIDQAPSDTVITRLVVTTVTLLVAGLLVTRLRGSLEHALEEMARHARHDPLTGILNRRGLEERAAVEVARARRDAGSLALLAADVDAFKALNDSLGHPAGDEVLCTVAGAMREQTREIDAAARVGGDEFAVLLPGASLDEARTVAQRLRVTSRRELARKGYASTVSLGVASSGRSGGPSFEALWSAADAALYEAKRAGGDRVSSAGAPRRR